MYQTGVTPDSGRNEICAIKAPFLISPANIVKDLHLRRALAATSVFKHKKRYFIFLGK